MRYTFRRVLRLRIRADEIDYSKRPSIALRDRLQRIWGATCVIFVIGGEIRETIRPRGPVKFVTARVVITTYRLCEEQ